VLFQGGRFSAHDVGQTAQALTGYAFGLLGLIAVKILAPGFYARQDIRTPVKIAVVALLATQASNLILVPLFAHAGSGGVGQRRRACQRGDALRRPCAGAGFTSPRPAGPASSAR
jgi:peptidoglycan biosynthesis protein MviN/MurJ (putative lipid II flippase)